jgi:hypothetical protein
VYAHDTEWSALELAGAFVAGAALTALAFIRLARVLVALFSGSPRPRPRDPHDVDDGSSST